MHPSPYLSLHRVGRGCSLGPVRGFVPWGSLNLAIWLAVLFSTPAAESSGFSLRWATNSNRTIVEVVGLSETTFRQLQGMNWQAENWQKLLSVYVGQGDFIADLSVPPMLGSYGVESGLIRFQPKFPLERGV